MPAVCASNQTLPGRWWLARRDLRCAVSAARSHRRASSQTYSVHRPAQDEHHKFATDISIKALGLEGCAGTLVGNAMIRCVSEGSSGCTSLALPDFRY